jgi:HK97 family phage major capsid protein
MPYDGIISRTDASDLIPEEQAAEIITATVQASAALQLCRRVTMSSKITRQPVLSALPSGYWVDGDTGLKQTTEAAWDGITLEAEEIAVLVPCPEAVIADAAYDVWAELREPIAQEFGRVLDAAVFAGTNKPASWPDAIIPAAVAAGNVETQTSAVAEGGTLNDLEKLLTSIEEGGFEPSGYAASRKLKTFLRRARDANGQPLGDGSTSSAWDLPIIYAPAGAFAATDLAVAGDFTMAVVGVRQDLSFKVLDQAVVTDAAGVVTLNAAQQDTLILRVVARYGYATAVPATLIEAGATGTPFPFAVLRAAVGAQSARAGRSRTSE